MSSAHFVKAAEYYSLGGSSAVIWVRLTLLYLGWFLCMGLLSLRIDLALLWRLGVINVGMCRLLRLCLYASAFSRWRWQPRGLDGGIVIGGILFIITGVVVCIGNGSAALLCARASTSLTEGVRLSKGVFI